MQTHKHLIIWFVFLVILLDQVSKWAIVQYIKLYETIPVIPHFFNLVHTRNRGMAFGIMNRPDFSFGFYLLAGASIGAIVLLVFWFLSLDEQDKGLEKGIALILGGAIGNLIDRIRLGAVIDFLDLYLGSYHWPAFNVSDSAITIGAFWVAVNYLFFHKKTSA